MNLRKLDGLLGAVSQLLEAGDGDDEATLIPLLRQLYEEMVGKYRPLVRVMPEVAGLAAKDLVPVVKTVLKLVNELRGDEGVQETIAAGNEQKAMMRMRALESYIAAGFSRPEAMALVLQDVANAKAQLHRVEASASSSGNRK